MEMGTFFTLVLAMSCSIASAQWGNESNSSTTTEPIPVVSPTQTPSPPVVIVNKTFTLNDTEKTNEICLRMSAAIEFAINYINETKANITTTTVVLTDSVSVNMSDSFCNATATTARLHLFMPSNDMIEKPISIVFTFTGDNRTGSTHWEMGNMTFTLDTGYLDHYNASNMTFVDFTTTDKLHQDPNNEIEFSRSYKCDSNQELTFAENVMIIPLVNISQLQVQVFSFTNKTSGEFDNARVCLLDTAGTANKIVPIAVGAALAGLVVVVLIAYLIGRLRSRRQSSYEALS